MTMYHNPVEDTQEGQEELYSYIILKVSAQREQMIRLLQYLFLCSQKSGMSTRASWLWQIDPEL